MDENRHGYPDNWGKIAKRVKDEAKWKCIRCDHPHDMQTGHVLTVHHLDMNKANCEWWNLVALCQRCHLHIQSKVTMSQPYMFEHSSWFKPYVAGYYADRMGLPTSREWVMGHIDYILDKMKEIQTNGYE